MSQEGQDPQDPAANFYSGEDAPNDGICFTAGITSAPFAAGVIHAYLAADRRPPMVVAGISMEALSAAGMQRAYHKLNKQKTDAGVPRQPRRHAGRIVARAGSGRHVKLSGT
jgi:hypothetical protein